MTEFLDHLLMRGDEEVRVVAAGRGLPRVIMQTNRLETALDDVP